MPTKARRSVGSTASTLSTRCSNAGSRVDGDGRVNLPARCSRGVPYLPIAVRIILKLAPFLIAFVLSAALVPFCRRLALRLGRVAHPRADRWHGGRPVALL